MPPYKTFRPVRPSSSAMTQMAMVMTPLRSTGSGTAGLEQWSSTKLCLQKRPFPNTGSKVVDSDQNFCGETCLLPCCKKKFDIFHVGWRASKGGYFEIDMPPARRLEGSRPGHAASAH